MGINEFPEVKLARKIIKKHSLSVPFDIETLIREYATLIYEQFPIEGVDGVSINIKVPRKKPTVVVNSYIPKTRRLFTLAHELGHLIIPWHIGTIIDEISDEKDNNFNQAYWEIEREANRFAAELLMPLEWIFTIFQTNRNLEYVCNQIYSHCGVSELAARVRIQQIIPDLDEFIMPAKWIQNIYESNKDLVSLQRQIIFDCSVSAIDAAKRIRQVLPSNIIYCAEQKGVVVDSGSTTGTHAQIQYKDEAFIKVPYLYIENYFIFKAENINIHWWTLCSNLGIMDDLDNRTWREILNNIAEEISPKEGIVKFKASVNGVVSVAHGSMKNKNIPYNIEALLIDFIHRLDNAKYADLIRHKDFLIFIKKRAKDFLNSTKK